MPTRLPASFVVSTLVAGVIAVCFPQSWGNQIRGSAQFLFWPASLLHDATARLSDRPVQPGTLRIDPSTPAGEQIRLLSEENNRLGGLVATLETQAAALRGQLSEEQRLKAQGETGMVQARVVGVDPGGRDLLQLSLLGSKKPVEVGMPVVYPGGVAGKISAVGVAGQATVRLITDRDFKVRASFGRFVEGKFVPIKLDPIVIEGRGNDEIRISLLKQPDVEAAGLVVNDWVVLADPSWPASLQGSRLGAISYVGQRQDATGFAEVRVRPHSTLTTLRELIVLVGSN